MHLDLTSYMSKLTSHQMFSLMIVIYSEANSERSACLALLQHLTQDISDLNPRLLGEPNFNPSEICSTQCVQLQFDGMIARGDHLHHEDISGRNVVITKAKFLQQI
jgi:hypothetical protein